MTPRNQYLENILKTQLKSTYIERFLIKVPYSLKFKNIPPIHANTLYTSILKDLHEVTELQMPYGSYGSTHAQSYR